tara:strand:+ start:1422 stop:1814 length:393 start_codon:yes stop_codon:yes gene_type:complete
MPRLTFFIYETIVLENGRYQECYIVEPRPMIGEPLYEQTRVLRSHQLSQFSGGSSMMSNRMRTNCVVGIKSFMNYDNSLMMCDEIPILINFLEDNGYTIEERMTRLMETRVGNNGNMCGGKLLFVLKKLI